MIHPSETQRFRNLLKRLLSEQYSAEYETFLHPRVLWRYPIIRFSKRPYQKDTLNAPTTHPLNKAIIRLTGSFLPSSLERVRKRLSVEIAST